MEKENYTEIVEKVKVEEAALSKFEKLEASEMKKLDIAFVTFSYTGTRPEYSWPPA